MDNERLFAPGRNGRCRRDFEEVYLTVAPGFFANASSGNWPLLPEGLPNVLPLSNNSHSANKEPHFGPTYFLYRPRVIKQCTPFFWPSISIFSERGPRVASQRTKPSVEIFVDPPAASHPDVYTVHTITTYLSICCKNPWETQRISDLRIVSGAHSWMAANSALPDSSLLYFSSISYPSRV